MKLSTKLGKLFAHLKYRATRLKTYLALMLTCLSAALPYLAGTDWLEYASKAMAVCAFMVAVIGGSNANSDNSAG